jgi:hypothetical protein
MKTKFFISLLFILSCLFAGNAHSQSEISVYKDLIGRWVRPDGGYVLVINNIEEDGRIDATYLQPRNIHVSQAEIITEEGGEYIYVELQDTGYPGSNYKLKHDTETDRLVGVYYHAVLKQKFDIFFIREGSKEG